MAYSRNKEDLRYLFCLFKIEGHQTWRLHEGKTVEKIELHLRTQIGKNKVTEKKFYEVNRLTAEIKELK